jgi:hypothetical protein
MEPVWTRHDTLWVYNIPEPQQVTFRCLECQTWATHSRELSGSGFVFNAMQLVHNFTCNFGTVIVLPLLIFLIRPYFCGLITFCFAKEALPSQTEDELPTSGHPSSTQLRRVQPHEEPARRMATFTTYRNAK